MSLSEAPEPRLPGWEGVEEQAVRLRRFLMVNTPGTAVGAISVAIIALLTKGSGYLWVVAAVVAAYAVVNLWALRRVTAGQLAIAVVVMAISLWILVLVVTLLLPVMLPLMVALVTFPVVLALPYVGKRALRELVLASVAMAGAVAGLGRLQNFSHATRSVPSWLPSLLIVLAIPGVIGLVALTLSHSSSRLTEALARAEASNRALLRSEGELRVTATELRASRARVVAAADAERQRIERDLHDGAQQLFAAVSVGLRIVARRAESVPTDVRRSLAELADQLDDANDELRHLAHGIYPSVLLDGGLTDVLAVMARGSGLPVSVEAHGCTRYSPDVEAAAYFCCLEAVRNANKHAGPGAQISIRLWEGDDEFRFEVADDGVGFTLQDGVAGAMGLVSLADRLGGLGGRFRVESQPGHGTAVRGALPLGSRDRRGSTAWISKTE
jgi:signal transduction histidine kinase